MRKLPVVALCMLWTWSARADMRVVEWNAPDAAVADSAAVTPSPATVEPADQNTANAGQGEANAAVAEVVAPVVPEPPSEPRPDHRYLDLTGFVQPGFIARLTDAKESEAGFGPGISDSTFWLQRARFGFRAQIFEWLRARLEIEFAPVTLLQDAYLDIAPHPAINVRLGQFIVPFLRAYSFNELNLAFLDRPIYTPISPDRGYIRYLSPRDVGAMVSGQIGNTSPESTSPVFEYQLALMIGRGPNIALNDDKVFLWAGRVQLHALGVPDGANQESDLVRNEHPRQAIAVGGYSNCDDRGNWNRGFTVDAEFRYRGLYASAAWVWFRNGASDGNFLSDSPQCRGVATGTGTETIEFVSRGIHAQVQYVLPRLFTNVFPNTMFSKMDFELLTRFDWVDANSPYASKNPLFGGGSGTAGYTAPSNYTDTDNSPTRWRLTFGLNFFPTGQQQYRFGINYQLNRETEDVVTSMGLRPGVKNDILWLQVTAGL